MTCCTDPRRGRRLLARRAPSSATRSRSAGERARSRSSCSRRATPTASAPYAGRIPSRVEGLARYARIASTIRRLRERSSSLARRSAAARTSFGSVMAMRAKAMAYSVLLGMRKLGTPGGKGRPVQGAGCSLRNTYTEIAARPSATRAKTNAAPTFSPTLPVASRCNVWKRRKTPRGEAQRRAALPTRSSPCR